MFIFHKFLRNYRFFIYAAWFCIPSIFFFFLLGIGIGYVIRLIPNRYEEEYIDRSIADCIHCSFICRLPSANIRRIHARRRNNLAISQTRPAFVLRCGTPIKMDVDICENDTAIAMLCSRSCLPYALFSPAFNASRSIAIRYTSDPFLRQASHATILARLIRFY